jgi:lysophospholipase L1-like esterase
MTRKNLLILSVVGAVLVIAVAAGLIFITREDDEVWIYAQTPVPPPEERDGKPLIITIGDSIAAGWGSCEGAPCEGIELDWWQDALAEDAIVLSRGIGNSTTADLLTRWDQDTKDAEILIVLAGVNDVARKVSAEDMLVNFETMKTRAESAGIVPVFCTVMPSDTNDTPEKMAVWDEVNAELRRRGEEDGWHIIDLAAEMEDPENPGHLRRDEVALSAVAHPRVTGYARMIVIVQTWWDAEGNTLR